MSRPPPAASFHHWSDRCGGTPGQRARSSAARDTTHHSHCSSAQRAESLSPPLCAWGSLCGGFSRQKYNFCKSMIFIILYIIIYCIIYEYLYLIFIIKGCTYLFRYLQIIPATFSQFFLVAQNIKQDCWGITSVTRAIMWSGSSFCIPMEYFYKQTKRKQQHTHSIKSAGLCFFHT